MLQCQLDENETLTLVISGIILRRNLDTDSKWHIIQSLDNYQNWSIGLVYHGVLLATMYNVEHLDITV